MKGFEAKAEFETLRTKTQPNLQKIVNKELKRNKRRPPLSVGAKIPTRKTIPAIENTANRLSLLLKTTKDPLRKEKSARSAS